VIGSATSSAVSGAVALAPQRLALAALVFSRLQNTTCEENIDEAVVARVAISHSTKR
jgi:hypothetical protein